MSGVRRLLFITPTYYPATYWGGPIFSVFGLCNALAANPGLELRVLTTDSAGPRLSQRVEVKEFPARYVAGYDVYFTRRRWGNETSPGLLARLWGLICWADVVHLTGTYSLPVIPTLLVCRMLGKPVVWSPRGGLQRWAGSSRPWAKRQWERLCNALLLKGRAVVHVTSEDEERESAWRIPRAEVACIPNGVDLPTLPGERVWKPAERLRLLYMGRLDPKKGIENLLTSLSLLSGVDAQLTICGRGAEQYEEKLHRLVEKLTLAERVQFLGLVEGKEKARAFFEADICVVPSFTENFGMVVAEALAHGVPVIASRGTPWAELEQRGCGQWVDNSPQSLSNAILQMSKADLRGMGIRGHAWMKEEFSWAKIAQSMELVYRRLV